MASFHKYSAAALIACALATSLRAHSIRRAIIVSWDGAPDWVVDRMLAEGKLPNVAHLAEAGMSAEYLLPNNPSVTACGHAAIWTAAWGDVNGITGNDVPMLPRAEHTILETRRGFSSESLLAEPIYLTAALSGKKVVVLSATQSYPPDPYISRLESEGLHRSRFISFSGFETSIERAKLFDAKELSASDVWTTSTLGVSTKHLSTRAGDEKLNIFVYDDSEDSASGFDSVQIQVPSTGATLTLKPRSAENNFNHIAGPIQVRKGNDIGLVYFRLFELSPDGSKFLLYQRAVNAYRGSASPEETLDYLHATGGFHDDVFWEYARGGFGPPIWEGGDGTAEDRAMELVRFDIELLRRGTRYGLQTWAPDLMFHYSSASDSAGHTWMGILDPDSSTHDPALAAKLWPHYEQVLMLQDEWLGDMIRFAAEEQHTAICLVSDHGMAGGGKRFYPNATLEQAGLLIRTPDSKIDLTQTKILAPPWSDYSLAINGTDWKGGIVPPGERASVINAARAALLAYRDPETNLPVVTKVLAASDVEGLGFGGPAGGDLLFDLHPNYYWNDGRNESPVAPASRPKQGHGMHGRFSHARKMHAIWYMAGPGIKPGVKIPAARQIDVAPTIAALIRMPAPAQSQGHIISEALRPE